MRGFRPRGHAYATWMLLQVQEQLDRILRGDDSTLRGELVKLRQNVEQVRGQIDQESAARKAQRQP